MGILKPDEACKFLRISDATLRRMIYSNQITFRKIGARYFFLESDLTEYVESAKQPMVMAEPVEAVI